MVLKFSSGNYEELKEKFKSIIDVSLWKELSVNTFQAKLPNGAIVNYFSSTGTIQVQGKPEVAAKTRQIIENALKDKIISNEDEEYSKNEQSSSEEEDDDIFLSSEFPDTEIVIGLVGAVGIESDQVIGVLKERLHRFYNYGVDEIKVSNSIIMKLPFYETKQTDDEYNRIVHLIEQGNKAREITKNNAILALGVANEIIERRKGKTSRAAYIINTLKHPEEVKYLREIYGRGFYLIGVFADQQQRHMHLTRDLLIPDNLATDLIERDKDEKIGHGQHTSDTFDLSDFFVYVDEDRQKLKSGIYRFLEIIFGGTTVTPTFEEYAMFMAFANSLRSADLSRQVGAVLSKDNDIVASGTNDIPKYGGGLYWPYYDDQEKNIVDAPGGRDYKRGYDSNTVEKQLIIDDILEKLPETVDKDTVEKVLQISRIKDLTEYGRVVHAEMETILVCARNNISAKDGVLFCTTFPCHNCAKHIVAAGIKRVVYIEPYPKSKALEFHSDSIVLGFAPDTGNDSFVYFEPFTGLGPRKFFDLFSMSLGSGRTIKRKDHAGKTLEENSQSRKVKLPLIPLSYLEREERAAKKFSEIAKVSK